jgi:type IV secretory pathway protease TraF
MFPLIAADTAAIVQGAVTLVAIAGGISWLFQRREDTAKAQALGARVASKGAIASRLGDLVLYVDPPRLAAINAQDQRIKVWQVTAGVRASVEVAGSISVTRGRNLAAKAVGGAVVPGGVFLFGNARETAHDNRELFLIVEGPDWAHTHAVDPSAGVNARRFAQAINLAARKLEPAADRRPAPPAKMEGDVIERLERLTTLRDSGALTAEEFETQKRAVLRPD